MNTILPQISRDPQLTGPSKIAVGQIFVEALGQTFDVVEYEVMNNAGAANAFGTIGLKVDPLNPNKGKLHAWVTRKSGGNFVFQSRVDKLNDGAVDILLKFATVVTKTSQILAKPQTSGTITFGVIHREIKHFDEIHDDVTSWVAAGFVTLTANVQLPGGFEGIQTETIVAAGTTHETGGTVFWSKVEDIDEAHALRTTITWDAAQTRLDSEFEPEYNFEVQSVHTIVAAGTTIAPTVGKETVIEPVNALWSIKIVKTITTSAKTAYKNIGFTFPTLLLNGAVDAVFIDAQARTFFKVNINTRQGFRAVVPALLTITFSNTVTAPPSLYQMYPRSERYNGVFFDFFCDTCLHDALSLTGTTDVDDTFWGASLTETAVANATSPTAAAYIADIATTKDISFESGPWKFGLWKNVKVSVVLR